MLQNQNLQLHNTYTTLQVGSPPPTLPCPCCPRHFRSKGGRTKHIQVKHHMNGPNPHASKLTLPPSPAGVPFSDSSHSSSHNFQFKRPPSSIPVTSDSSCGEVDAADNFSDIGIDAEYPLFDRDYIPPDLNVGDELNEDPPPRDSPMEQHAPNPSHITYIYHPKLNGK